MLTMNGVTPLGLRVVVLFNKITGLWLQVPTSRSRRLAVSVFEWFIVAVLIYNIIYTFIRLLSIKNFVLLILSTSSLLIMIQSTFSSIILLITKRHINSILKEAQFLIELSSIRHYQAILLRRMSKRSAFYLIFLFSAFVITQMNSLYFTTSITINPAINDTNPEKQFIEEAIGNSGNERNIIKILLIISFFSQTLAIFKLISMDLLLLTLLYFMSEELKILRATLHEAMLLGQVLAFRKVDLGTWLSLQCRLSRLLSRINKTWAPMIVVTVLGNTLSICFLSYTIVRVLEFKTLVWIVAGYTLMTFLDVFLYCEAGHRLRTQGEAITEAACQGPWIQMKPSLVPGMHLVTNNCSRCFVVRGGPFFTLSLEFFASLVGAVFTYFVVLLQFK